MVIMAVVMIMMMRNLVVLKIRLISGIKLDNDGKRIASYNQVFSSIKRFFLLTQFLQIFDNNGQVTWRQRRGHSGGGGGR